MLQKSPPIFFKRSMWHLHHFMLRFFKQYYSCTKSFFFSNFHPPYTWICLRCLEQAKHIFPNGGFNDSWWFTKLKSIKQIIQKTNKSKMNIIKNPDRLICGNSIGKSINSANITQTNRIRKPWTKKTTCRTNHHPARWGIQKSSSYGFSMANVNVCFIFFPHLDVPLELRMNG